MKTSSLLLLAAMLALTACGSGGSSRPKYSGHEESTVGVPGFTPDGTRKLSPYVKLGQSYTVNGKTYVPRYQPDYTEEGMASWYGPGFHGGKTANGETFSTNDHTAAHTTLPLPSIVKVTYLKTGRSTYARVNDRGPFAHGRIIDVSKAVAEDIGMIRDGVGKVRVEYMAAESEKFAELIADGREPGSIDLASEVIGKTPNGTMYADMPAPDDSIQVTDAMPASSAPKSSVWQQMNPVASAQAAEPTIVTPPVETMPPAVLPPPAGAAAPIVTAAVIPATPAPAPAPVIPPVAPGPYVQLGSFGNQANAVHMQQRFSTLAPTNVTPTMVNGATLYRVRMGPFLNEDAAAETLERAHQMGVGDAKLVVEYATK